jgi:serine/tyrosine/threonine adenylyltransferase
MPITTRGSLASSASLRDWLALLARHEADFTLSFRRLAQAPSSEEAQAALRSLFGADANFDDWLGRWQARIEPEQAAETMRRANPAYIPRNHQVEAAIAAATANADFGPFEALLAALARPFDEQPQFAGYALPAKPEERVLRTFCGT